MNLTLKSLMDEYLDALNELGEVGDALDWDESTIPTKTEAESRAIQKSVKDASDRVALAQKNLNVFLDAHLRLLGQLP